MLPGFDEFLFVFNVCADAAADAFDARFGIFTAFAFHVIFADFFGGAVKRIFVQGFLHGGFVKPGSDVIPAFLTAGRDGVGVAVRKHGHRVVRSSALIPADDPTLLFTNAGMNQFKDYFLGNAVPEYRRAVTCQKVMRAGGKHNDLENVGRTARHHTFFEMLGNFSFGDYFKEDAIRFAWAFLTEELRIPPDKLAVSVYEKDDDAFSLWNTMIGIPAARIARLGEKDNFWAMETPVPAGRVRKFTMTSTVITALEEDDGRFLEIWNLVFMQFDRQKDSTMTPLPKPSIDTGMGLERIASVMAHVKSNYETSLFEPLLADIARNAGYTYGTGTEKDVSCKVIADHVRALTFLIQDGLIPGNDGRGYVMRRILRRAARHARNLGAADGFLAQTVPSVVRIMKGAYPEISEAQTYIEKIIFTEEKRFSGTLHHGMKYLEDLIEGAQKIRQSNGQRSRYI
ncbi:hypothetical protein CHS0354_030049 [Potamilus streckersoni]|uniref:Alanine--tRNA ligase n=1 Tax=Potamilus streckersoni TaxID=2493646 RepID=A0AAE0VG16_9BIVA|nr:hypothetical protein CHS0354_030049 [Potamilus streckersoni]